MFESREQRRDALHILHVQRVEKWPMTSPHDFFAPFYQTVVFFNVDIHCGTDVQTVYRSLSDVVGGSGSGSGSGRE